MKTRSLGLLVDEVAVSPMTEPATSPYIPPLAHISTHRYNDERRPPTPVELESLDVVEAPLNARSAELIQTVWQPYKNRYRFIAAGLCSLCSGLNDAAPGALLPYIEDDYSIGYAVVSTVFVANAFGFIAAAFFIDAITVRFGRSNSLMVAMSLLLCEYVAIVNKPPFPVIVAAFFVNGLGGAISLAICNVFCANLQHGTVLCGIYQGMYGLGGTVGPLIATALVSRDLHWTSFYFVTLGVAAVALCFAGWAFRGYETEAQYPRDSDGSFSSVPMSRWAKLKVIITDRATVLGSCFIFAYQGTEVAISGWVISFLVSYRSGDIHKVGYVTAGFWAGITLGRFVLSHLGTRIGQRLFVCLLTCGALILQLLVWFVPSVIGDSIAVALAGLLIGPIYPGATSLFVRLIPKHMQVASFSLIASIGSSGGAFVPFMIGLLAQQAGTWVLHPICIGLFCVMMVLWFVLPKEDAKRSE